MTLKETGETFRAQVHRIVIGQEETITLSFLALTLGGHVLIEGVPGTAKTLLARTIAQLVGGTFKRIQFTPDLMPSDVVGTSVYELATSSFRLRLGPIFANIVLADEVNRAPAKTQSALLEAMEEKQVTLEGDARPLPDPFLVLATQNPVEYEGTYPLPEAELDRFLFKAVMRYPEGTEERDILRAHDKGQPLADVLGLEPLPGGALTEARAEVDRVTVEDSVLDYVVRIVAETRRSPDLLLGASPRAGVHLLRAAKASAALDGRDFVTPDDVKALGADAAPSRRAEGRGRDRRSRRRRGPAPRAVAARRPEVAMRPRVPRFVPRPRLLALVLASAVLLALATLSPVFAALAGALAVAAFALAITDYRLAPALDAAHVARVAEPQLIIGAPNRVGVTIRNPTARPLRLRVRDDVPPSFAVAPRTSRAVVAPGGSETVEYVARPRHRGSFRFGSLHTRQRGPLDLVERQSEIGAGAPAHVYPDLREIRRYEVSLRRGLAYDAGHRRARLPGAGSVFERLREYGPDDDPRSISWTATARRGRPISVEYETERQQRVLILLDAGRMMASTLGELTKLDHAVNTALMLSYVATAKGDEVGLLGFADDVRSYVVPRRGRRQFLRLTEELRRLEVTTTEPDYRAAFEFLRSRTSRRALVVLFTDLVDVEASRALVAAVNRLAGNHLVLCCLLADPGLAAVAARAPTSTTELYERVVAEEVRDARGQAIALLRERGVHVVDVPAERLTVAAIQRYLELKKRWL